MKFLVAHNRPRMDGFKRWLLAPGMRFQARVTWWGGEGPRPAPHEGLDLCRFEVAGGLTKNLDRHTRIPAAFAGEVAKIERDFLGQSIFMNHALLAEDGRRLLSAFGHTIPRESLQVRAEVAAGEVIAVLAGYSGKTPGLEAHLHLTFAWVPVDLKPVRLSWKTLGQDPEITLIDPLPLVSGNP